jgi:hypothetical protein
MSVTYALRMLALWQRLFTTPLSLEESHRFRIRQSLKSYVASTRRVPAPGETYGNRAWYCISRKINILNTKN